MCVSGSCGWGPSSVAALVLAGLFAGLTPVPVAAHQNSVSYAAIAIRPERVEITFEIAYDDWLPMVNIDTNRDGTLTTQEARQHLRQLGSFMRSRASVVADGAPCPGEVLDVQVTPRLGTAYTTLQTVYRCPTRIRTVAIAMDLFGREHPGHRTLARIQDRTVASGPLAEHVFGAGSEGFEMTLGDPAALGRLGAVRAFVRLGVDHIFSGYDHILFLLGLLLVATGFRDLLKIVTSFTVAHTLTLVLATLGYVTLNVRLVESVIALSIAYVAVENLVAQQHPRRWILTFAFGLVHGFGFSNVLREMDIPRAVLGWSLASFNVGVEVGQVTIVSVFYPLLVWNRTRSWNASAVRAASVAIGVMAVYWFIERALLAA